MRISFAVAHRVFDQGEANFVNNPRLIGKGQKGEQRFRQPVRVELRKDSDGGGATFRFPVLLQDALHDVVDAAHGFQITRLRPSRAKQFKRRGAAVNQALSGLLAHAVARRNRAGK